MPSEVPLLRAAGAMVVPFEILGGAAMTSS